MNGIVKDIKTYPRKERVHFILNEMKKYHENIESLEEELENTYESIKLLKKTNDALPQTPSVITEGLKEYELLLKFRNQTDAKLKDAKILFDRNINYLADNRELFIAQEGRGHAKT